MTIAKRPWGTPCEVRIDQTGCWNRRGRWFALYSDVLSRVERTEPGFAVEYPFDDMDEAQRAIIALRHYFQRYGNDEMRVRARRDMAGAPRLCAWREKKEGGEK